MGECYVYTWEMWNETSSWSWIMEKFSLLLLLLNSWKMDELRRGLYSPIQLFNDCFHPIPQMLVDRMVDGATRANLDCIAWSDYCVLSSQLSSWIHTYIFAIVRASCSLYIQFLRNFEVLDYSWNVLSVLYTLCCIVRLRCCIFLESGKSRWRLHYL